MTSNSSNSEKPLDEIPLVKSVESRFFSLLSYIQIKSRSHCEEAQRHHHVAPETAGEL